MAYHLVNYNKIREKITSFCEFGQSRFDNEDTLYMSFNVFIQHFKV